MSRWQPASPEERFWPRVAQAGECWEWTGSRTRSGYGVFWCVVTVPAHRFAYEDLRTSIPEGLQLDHLCRNRACVNPWHLEPVTRRENVARSLTPARPRCKYGHGLDESNVYTRPGTRTRVCRECVRQRQREWRQRRRERGVAVTQQSV